MNAPIQSETVDPKTFRKGDRVWVENVLAEDWRDGVSLIFAHSYVGTHYVDPRDVKRHFPAPRPIEVGDRVHWRSNRCTVAAIAGMEVWLKSAAGIHHTALLSDLERIEP